MTTIGLQAALRTPCAARSASAAAAPRRHRRAGSTPSAILQDALDLAAEVGVAGRVDEVDLDVAEREGDVLGQDGDAALALQVVGVEDALLRRSSLVAEQAGLPQHLIDQRRLAVVDVGDDGHIADVVSLHSLSGGLPAAFFIKWVRKSDYTATGTNEPLPGPLVSPGLCPKMTPPTAENHPPRGATWTCI